MNLEKLGEYINSLNDCFKEEEREEMKLSEYEQKEEPTRIITLSFTEVFSRK